jgi:hypothetical protein
LITDKKGHVPNAAQQLGQDDACPVVVGVFSYFVVQHRHFPLHAVQQLLQHGRGEAQRIDLMDPGRSPHVHHRVFQHFAPTLVHFIAPATRVRTTHGWKRNNRSQKFTKFTNNRRSAGPWICACLPQPVKQLY